MAKMAISNSEDRAMQITATEAKNRFGQICAQAKREPVFIEKGGRVDSVVMSLEQFEALRRSAQSPSLAQRRRAFNAQYRDWIAEQNRDFEQHGLWCDGWVAWQAN
jgi:prevent-host-death family protein